LSGSRRLAPLLGVLPLLAGCAPARRGADEAAAPSAALARAVRPIPYPVFETPAFRAAVERGTRTRTGRPGPNYWTNTASYRLEADLDPGTNMLTGQGTIRYQNNSPDTLRSLALHLHQNLFAPDAMRNSQEPVTGGMRLTRVAVRGRDVPPAASGAGGAPGYARFGTILRVGLADAPLLPGQSIDLEFQWSYSVNPDGGDRGGQDGQVWFIAYWYPQLAVYDDSRLWQIDQYLGTSEFYMGYADYDVALSVPEGFLVSATGVLQNAAEVLSDQTQARLVEARRGERVVHVVEDADRGAGRATRRSANGRLTWRFRASTVRDFAFATSGQYLWDATIAAVGDANGDGRPDTSDIHSFWRPERRAWAWDQSARYGRHSIEFLSRYLWPYPYPHMTAVEGVESCGGMEYPMMTCIGGRRDTLSLYSVTVHEFAHMWFPMQVGSDEKRYAWQDEGLTRFNQAQAMREFFPGFDLLSFSQRGPYVNLARSGDEVELMRHGDLYPINTPAYGVASYNKMALNLHALRALLGDSMFLAAYREYGRRWINRHPTPVRLLQHLQRRGRARPLVVLAHLVVRDLAARSGHRGGTAGTRGGGRRSRGGDRGSRAGADAGAAGRDPAGRGGGTAGSARGAVAGGGAARGGADSGRGGRRAGRDRSRDGLSRRGSRQPGVAALSGFAPAVPASSQDP